MSCRYSSTEDAVRRVYVLVMCRYGKTWSWLCWCEHLQAQLLFISVKSFFRNYLKKDRFKQALWEGEQ